MVAVKFLLLTFGKLENRKCNFHLCSPTPLFGVIIINEGKTLHFHLCRGKLHALCVTRKYFSVPVQQPKLWKRIYEYMYAK